MGYREMFLVLLSMVLLSLLMLQVNSNAVESRDTLQELELEHAALAVAQQFIEEGKSKKFDAQIGMVSPSTMPGSFTPYNSLGHGWWESYPNFNDVDDYHNFSQTVYVNGIDFQVLIEVKYVQDTNPDLAVNANTYFKRMTVTVSSSYLPRSVTLKYVFSYFGVNL